MDIDVVVLSRTEANLARPVVDGILHQAGVRTRLHRVIGKRLPQDSCRLETIARARNAGRYKGKSPWLMFVDDDVVLGPGCINQLLVALQRDPRFAAMAADCSNDRGSYRTSPHVTVGATLFRRPALDAITFRWQEGKCECQCCCDDLRRLAMGIKYHPTAPATHDRRLGVKDDQQACWS